MGFRPRRSPASGVEQVTTEQTGAERLRSRRALMIVREPAVAITIMVIASALAVFVVYPPYLSLIHL